MVLWFYNGPLVSKEHCSAPLISKEHYSAPLADNSAPLLKGALLKWANSALQKSNIARKARMLDRHCWYPLTVCSFVFN